MFGHGKSPLHRHGKHFSANPKAQSSNPFDSDDESDKKQTLTSAKRTSSEPSLSTPKFSTNPFDDNDEVKGTSSSLYSSDRNKYRNDFSELGGFENQSVQELENYAVYKAEETTKAVHGALKIAEDIREDATKTLVTLHYQGEQITRTHAAAADIDHDLSRGEKLLGSLGGMFSKTWKPSKGRPIKGPTTTRDDPSYRRGSHLEQREKLGLSSVTKPRSDARHFPEPANALQKVEVEKVKQDDALLDLSNVIGELKEMAIDMGSELDRQNKALDPLEQDVEELAYRVKGANARTRRLIGK